MNRAAGILLPITALPSQYGVGGFSPQAYAFVDWLKAAGQTLWQFLPLGPTGFGDSPYQSFSVYAGNPYFISLDDLIDEGLLTKAECSRCGFSPTGHEIDYANLHRTRLPLLRRAFERSGRQKSAEYQTFLAENGHWLPDYALFMALKDVHGKKPWFEWPEDERLRSLETLAQRRSELRTEIEFHIYLQFRFFRQYRALKKYANDRGIRLVGDIPIYAAPDSADVWAKPELFQLDERNMPIAVAGCPPDGFSEDGQLWGNPLYRWDVHRADGYTWWIQRLSHCFRLFDITRIDHFRGFDEYYSIPAANRTARGGHWEKGPGAELFRAAQEHLGRHEVIAEDLGFVTDSVRRMVRDCGFPGMKILQFAFDSRDTGSAADYLPHNYSENCAVYTGSHDNETLAGWLGSIPGSELEAVRDYLCDHFTPTEKLHRSLIALALRSSARLCIIPMQDWLGLDNRARMNTPSTLGGNWRWRIDPAQLTDALRDEILTFTVRYGRADQNV